MPRQAPQRLRRRQLQAATIHKQAELLETQPRRRGRLRRNRMPGAIAQGLKLGVLITCSLHDELRKLRYSLELQPEKCAKDRSQARSWPKAPGRQRAPQPQGSPRARNGKRAATD